MADKITITEEEFKDVAASATTGVILEKLMKHDITPEKAADVTLVLCQVFADIIKQLFYQGGLD